MIQLKYHRLVGIFINYNRLLIYLFSDPSEIAYSRTLVYGNEWTHLSFELLIFCLIDLIAHNFILAAAITYMVSTALRLVFRLFYTNNLVKSSLVDARFLI